MPEYGVQKFLYVIGAFVAVLIVVGLLLPRHTRVEVSALVDAPPATVFALVNDFRRVDLWSPKTASDPNARVIFSGPPRGIGATVTWDGVIVGSGTQAIVESRPYEHIATMINPGEAGEARTWFDFVREDGKTRVTWGFAHDHGLNLVGRYFALLLSGVVKREFENGIAALQELAESLPRTDFGDLGVEHVVVEGPEGVAFARPDTPLHAVDARHQQRAHRQVIVAAAIRGAELDALVEIRDPLVVERQRGKEDNEGQRGQTDADELDEIQQMVEFTPTRTLSLTRPTVSFHALISRI